MRRDLRGGQHGEQKGERTRHATGLMDENIDDRQKARAADPREQSSRDENQKCTLGPAQKETDKSQTGSSYSCPKQDRLWPSRIDPVVVF